MAVKKNHLFLIILFLAAIALPLVFSDKLAGKVSAMEKRTLAEFPRLLAEDGKLSPTFGSDLEKWIDDRVGLRVQAKSIQAFIDFKVLNTSPSKDVIVGSDGWFFYAGENNLEFAPVPRPLAQGELERIKQVQEAIQASMQKRGIKYVLVFIPSKESVYPEYMGGGFSVRDTTVDIVADYLQKNTTIPVINLKPDLLEAKKSEQVYYKNDTHWNGLGSYTGYSVIIHGLNDLGFIHSAPEAVTTSPSTHVGDLAVMMGGEDFLLPEAYDVIKKSPDHTVEITSGGDYDRLKALMDPEQVSHFSEYQNTSAEKVKLLIIGDSFFDGLRLPWLLAENFSQVDFVWTRFLKNEYVEQLKPDVVMVEMTERYITFVGTSFDPALSAAQ